MLKLSIVSFLTMILLLSTEFYANSSPLKKIEFSLGTLLPAFNPNHYHYTLLLPVVQRDQENILYLNLQNPTIVKINKAIINCGNSLSYLIDTTEDVILEIGSGDSILTYYIVMKNESPKLIQNSEITLMNVQVDSSVKRTVKYMDNRGSIYATLIGEQTIQKSDDFGNTWRMLKWIPNISFYSALLVSANLNVIIADDHYNIWVSDTTQQNFTQKASFYNNFPFIHLATCISDSIIVLGGYGVNKSAEVWLTLTNGNTWERIYFDTTDYVYANNYHVHAVEYDKYTRHIWVTTGDGNNKSLLYTINNGKDWEYVIPKNISCSSCKQFTSIIAFQHGIVFATDDYSTIDGLMYLPKHNSYFYNKENLFNTFEYITASSSPGLKLYGQNYSIVNYPNANLYLLPWRNVDEVDYFRIWTSFNGITWFESYVHNEKNIRFRNIIGPHPNDQLGRVFCAGDDYTELTAQLVLPSPKPPSGFYTYTQDEYIIFRWDDCVYNIKYLLEIATDSSFNNVSYSDSTIYGHWYHLNTDTVKKFIRMKAFGPLLASDWSEIFVLEPNPIITLESSNKLLKQRIILSECYPNPCAADRINFKYYLSSDLNISLKLYNSLGELVKVIYEGFHNRGEYTFTEKTTQFCAGVYYIISSSEENIDAKKIVITKY